MLRVMAKGLERSIGEVDHLRPPAYYTSHRQNSFSATKDATPACASQGTDPKKQILVEEGLDGKTNKEANKQNQTKPNKKAKTKQK